MGTASAQNYWRPEKGGKPDAGDPYDLEVPMVAFKDRVEDGKHLEKRLREEIMENKDTRRHAAGLLETIQKFAELNRVQDEKFAKKDAAGEATPKKAPPPTTTIPSSGPIYGAIMDEKANIVERQKSDKADFLKRASVSSKELPVKSSKEKPSKELPVKSSKEKPFSGAPEGATLEV